MPAKIYKACKGVLGWNHAHATRLGVWVCERKQVLREWYRRLRPRCYVDIIQRRKNETDKRLIPGFCHLIGDTPDVMHVMASWIGAGPDQFHQAAVEHYDLTPEQREAAVRLGAWQISISELQRIGRLNRQ